MLPHLSSAAFPFEIPAGNGQSGFVVRQKQTSAPTWREMNPSGDEETEINIYICSWLFDYNIGLIDIV